MEEEGRFRIRTVQMNNLWSWLEIERIVSTPLVRELYKLRSWMKVLFNGFRMFEKTVVC